MFGLWAAYTTVCIFKRFVQQLFRSVEFGCLTNQIIITHFANEYAIILCLNSKRTSTLNHHHWIWLISCSSIKFLLKKKRQETFSRTATCCASNCVWREKDKDKKDSRKINWDQWKLLWLKKKKKNVLWIITIQIKFAN